MLHPPLTSKHGQAKGMNSFIALAMILAVIYPAPIIRTLALSQSW